MSLISLGGTVLVAIIGFRTTRSVTGSTLAEQRDRTLNERFATAADRLGSDKPPAVRLAGVYAMAGLADDWPENRQTCVDILCAYLRLPYDPDPGDDAAPEERAAYRANREVRHTIIRLIARAICDPDAAVSWQGLNLDFTGVVFDGGDFTGAGSPADGQLRGAEFSGGTVNFSGAEFSGGTVNFSGAEFSGGTVSFGGAEFSGGTVSFDGAKFSGGTVDFSGAKFSGGTVSFTGAEFSGGTVDFDGAEFSGGTVDFSAPSSPAARSASAAPSSPAARSTSATPSSPAARSTSTAPSSPAARSTSAAPSSPAARSASAALMTGRPRPHSPGWTRRPQE